MLGFINRCCAVFCVLVICAACGRTAKTPSPVQVVADDEPVVPSEVELSAAKVTLHEPDIVGFEVKYRFTKGRPHQHYSCDISFPGSANQGVRLMESWELKGEGVIRDKVMLSKPGVKTFEIRMTEASSAQAPYKTISNVVTGPVE